MICMLGFWHDSGTAWKQCISWCVLSFVMHFTKSETSCNTECPPFFGKVSVPCRDYIRENSFWLRLSHSHGSTNGTSAKLYCVFCCVEAFAVAMVFAPRPPPGGCESRASGWTQRRIHRHQGNRSCKECSACRFIRFIQLKQRGVKNMLREVTRLKHSFYRPLVRFVPPSMLRHPSQIWSKDALHSSPCWSSWLGRLVALRQWGWCLAFCDVSRPSVGPEHVVGPHGCWPTWAVLWDRCQKKLFSDQKNIPGSKRNFHGSKKNPAPLALVLWSSGLWSSGPLVPWSFGPLVLWSFGPLVSPHKGSGKSLRNFLSHHISVTFPVTSRLPHHISINIAIKIVFCWKKCLLISLLSLHLSFASSSFHPYLHHI